MSEKAPLVETTVYVLDGITYVPHYRNDTIFVGPGYPRTNTTRYPALKLIDLGAEKQSMFLWSRGMHGVVDATHP
jgi:hypothetical protein